MEEQEFRKIDLRNPRNLISLVVLFAVSYFVIYMIYLLVPSMLEINLRSWAFTSIFKADYMNVFLPVAGFFAMFFVIEWANKYFKTDKASSWQFPALLIGLSVIAYYVALVWYFKNIEQLGNPNALNFDFWQRFFNSAFLMFVFGGFFGWLSNFILHRTQQ